MQEASDSAPLHPHGPIGVSMAKASMTNKIPAAQPRVRRGYFECRYGQLHVHNAIPPGGGFEEGTSLLCLHRTPLSGRLFERFLALAGRDRSVYAPDTPGFGDSDAPSARPTIADYASAIGDFLDSMRFRQIDVLGYQMGALMAAELAIARPQQIRRVVLVSVPALNDADRESFRQVHAPSAAVSDGSHLMSEWQRVRDTYGPGVPPEVAANAFAERLRSGTHGAWAVGAMVQYAARERLGLVTQPSLVLRPKDTLWEATQRVRELLPKARLMDLPEQGQGLFELSPETAVEATKDFLRG
jgi:pimeloyl-ACP methyl ester carboxylesterase